MSYEEMKALALYLTCSEDGRCKHRDLFYDTLKNIFLSQTASAKSDVAVAWVKGKTRQGHINKSCVHIGRYSVDVNPEWIIQDMQNV